MFLLSFILADTSTHSMIRLGGPFKFSSTFFRRDYIQLVIGNLVESVWSHLEFKNIQILGSKIKLRVQMDPMPLRVVYHPLKKIWCIGALSWQMGFWFSNLKCASGFGHQLKENILTPFLWTCFVNPMVSCSSRLSLVQNDSNENPECLFFFFTASLTRGSTTKQIPPWKPTNIPWKTM